MHRKDGGNRATARGGLTALCVWLLCAAACPAAAQDAGPQARAVRMPEMTVSARGYGAKASQTPGGVGVVTAQEIEETAPVSVTDAMERVPGVSKSTDSQWGGEIVIRGMSRDSVVFLIDGCRVNVTTDINGRFGLINPEDVERIEVLKGPVSALYGSGSTGGVVNIITKKGKFFEDAKWSGELALGGSTNPGGPDTYGNLSYGGKDAWIFASGGWRDHGDYFDGQDHEVRNSQYEDGFGKAAAAYRWNSQAVTEVQYQQVTGWEIGVPGTGSAPLPTNADVTLEENERQLVQVKHNVRNEGSILKESELMGYWQLIERNQRIDNFTSGSNRWLKPNADHETVGGNWKNVLELGSHTLVAGLDAWNWHMTSNRRRLQNNGVLVTDSPTPNTNQLSVGIYAEDDWEFVPDWTLNLGGRMDRVEIDNDRTATVSQGSRQDTDWNAHVGLTWDFADEWSMTGLAASSYRSPNILELFKNISLGGGVSEKGDPNLKSERSLYFEYGLHYEGPALRATTSLYANTVDDYIESRRVSSSLYQMSNVGKAQIRGVEQEVEWNFYQGFTAYANAAYAQGKDVTKDEPLRFVAPLNGLVGVRQRLDSGFWWAVESQWAAEKDNVPSGTPRSDEWAVLNARAGYGFTLGGLRNEIVAGVNNILDKAYHNYLATSRGIELMEPGLNAYATWRVKF